MKISILGIVIVSVTSIALGLLAPAGTTPPNPGYIHRVDFHSKTFWTDDEGATSTGAVPQDADKGFVPAAKGYSYGPENQTDPVCAQPPAQSTRDHATFSKAELANYGLPERLNGQSQAEWEQIVRHAQKRSCTLQTVYIDGRPARNGVPARHTMTPSVSKTLGTYYTTYHTGQFAFTGWGIDNDTYPLTEVVSYWHFPSVQACGLICDQTMSAWVGLGNDGVNPMCQGQTMLVQAGTVSFTQNNASDYHPFLQNLGSATNCGENRITSMLYANGDLMYVAVIQNDTAFVQDQTLNSYYSGPVPQGGGPYADESSAICTIEQNGGNKIENTLPNFGTVDFQWCRVYATVAGTSTLYALPHVPASAVYRHQKTTTALNPSYPSEYCAYAEIPNNPTNGTYPDSSFNVDFVNNCQIFFPS